MIIGVDLFLYLAVAVTLIYLIWRVARYSRFEDTPEGRSFMLMKVCLLVLVIYAFAVRFDPDGEWRDVARVVVIGGIWVALMYLVRVVVRNQGGFRRKRHLKRLDQDQNQDLRV